MEIGTVKLVDIDHEMRAAYLDYAMSVITARALPDVRDGLKPVQRRILFAMNELGLSHSSAYKKSARIVGEVLGKYHPHGDAPVYETMVRLAQGFSMRYMLVDGQGNFGSVDGDPPAAMRYTEARLAAIAEEILLDLDKNTVDLVDNFDATLKEPSVLPARVPNLLVNGAAGIAVGMATNIPPHNLTEVADAIIFILDQFQRAVDGGIPFEVAQLRVHGRPVDRDTLLGLRKSLSPAFKALAAQEYENKVAALDKAPKTREQKDELEHSALLDVFDQIVDVPVERLTEFVAGPDFPTAGIIVGRKGITDAFTTGHGRIVIRAKAFIEDRGGDRSTIIITELPYQVNKATLVERIADLVRDKRIEGVAELRDESDRQGMRIVIELRRDVPAKQILNNLFKLTAMQSTFSINVLALVDGEPRVLNLKRLLQHYIDYRLQVITRRTQFDLDKARARAHILEGLKIALDNLDEVISTIRNSPDAETARTRLMKKFKLSELQAQAILDMQLRRLAALERKKIEQELAETLKLIAQLEDLLAHPIKLHGLIKEDLLDLKQKYGDERRTKIREEEAEDFTAEDLIPDEDVVIAVSSRSYFKRVPADQYRAQPRRSGTRAATAIVSKEQDPAVLLHNANTHDNILFFSSTGKVYGMKCHEIPAADRQARGVPVSNSLSTAADERIAGMVAMREQPDGSVTLVTRRGEIKRLALSDLLGTRASGANAMALEPRDEVVWAGETPPGQQIVIVTARGQAIRFEPENEARASGRGSGGVRAIRLDDNDEVVAADRVDTDSELMVLTSRGFGKRTDMDQYSAQGRGGGGIMTATITEKNGPLAAACVVWPADDVMIVSAQGQVVRKPVDEIACQPRAGRGTSVVEIEKGDKPIALLRLRAEKKGVVQPTLPEPGAAPRATRKKPAAADAGESAGRAPAETAAPTQARVAASDKEKAPSGKAKAKAAPTKAEAAAPGKERRPGGEAASRAAAGEAKAAAPGTEKAPRGKAVTKAVAGKAKAAAPGKEKAPRGKAARKAPASTSDAAGSARPPLPLTFEGVIVADEPSRVPPPSPVRTRRQAAAPPVAPARVERPAAGDRTEPPARTAGSGEPRPAGPSARGEETTLRTLKPRQAGPPHQDKEAAGRSAKTGNGIVVRSGGKVTVIRRSALSGEPETKQEHRAPKRERQEDKKGKTKGHTQIPLPLWGDEPKKK